MPPRVVMIALDALQSEAFAQLMQAGRLPNLAKFAGGAERLDVRSDGETLHGSLWPTFASGTGPGTHGVYFWTQWLAEEMRYVRNSHEAFSFEPFWFPIARAGHQLTLLDVPYVPLARFPGSNQVAGWGTHDEVEPGAWPEGYGGEFRKRFGKHPLEFDTVEPQSNKDKLKMVREMRDGVGIRAKAFEQLLRERPAGFALCVFGETHKASHYLSSAQELAPGVTNVDAMAQILEPLDEAWPRIEAAAGPGANLVLFALHGTVEQIDFSATLGTQVLSIALGKEAAEGVTKPDMLRRVRNILPASLHRSIWRRVPARWRAAREGSRSGSISDVAHDALFRVAHDGNLGLRMNLRGRERDGIVSAKEGAAALAQLEALAGEFTVADGRPAFAGLWRSEQEAPGPRSHRLPDALLVSNPNVTATDTIARADGPTLHTDEPEARNGIHNGRGFSYFRPAAGDQIAFRSKSIDIREFAPAIQQIFGLEPSGDLEKASFLQ